MSLNVVKYIRQNIPLKWICFEFFIDVMSEINNETLSVPIYNSNIDLKSKKSIRNFDKRYPHDISLKKKIKLMIKHIINHTPKTCISSGADELLGEYKKYESDYSKILFNEELEKYITTFGHKKTNKILSLAMYLSNIERINR